MDRYEEHPSRVSRWQEGDFVLFDDAADADTTVWVVASEAEGDDPRLWEGLLCHAVDEKVVRICSIPYWVYDLSLGDEVEVVRSAEGPLVAVRPARSAGNYTFRVVVDESTSWRELMIDLEPHGCWFDVRTPNFLAISAPPEHAQAVSDDLRGREQLGGLQYETGHQQP